MSWFYLICDVLVVFFKPCIVEKMDNSNNTEPITPPIKINSSSKEYHCPHCRKFINADEKELMKSEND